MNFKLALISSMFVLLFSSCKKENSNKILFLENNPIIDGTLDKNLSSLKKRQFKYIWQFDNPVTDTVAVTYRMAYTPSHLYVYIETETDSINYRPRGFVNGDGFKLLLATPQKDSITNEYYDMVFSASKDKKYWARKRIWDYNHNQGSNKAFGDNTKFEEKNNGKTNGFEALIAWNDIPPYHPFFKEKIGYNLYFAKAISDTITNGYSLVEDEGIWDEELSKRKYIETEFDIPNKVDESIVLFQLKQRNFKSGSQLPLVFTSISNKEEDKNYVITILENDEVIFNKEKTVKTSKIFLKDSILLETQNLKAGNYKVNIKSSEERLVVSEQLTILPNIDLGQLKSEIEKNALGVNDGAKHTLLFRLNQYKEIVENLKPYESSSKAIDVFKKGYDEFTHFINGVDPYKMKKEPYRRAFLSEQDNTLQPYTIKIPNDYNPNKAYPLLVFLHGSGATDEGLLNANRSGGEFIEIAPFARDKFRAYTSEESQKDILEAIEDASKYFNVDRNNIIIGGFSMGGYGALRTFYENPEMYKGVVVHAGHPDLANYWLGGNHPNFLNSDYLKPFKGKRVFVYHGKKDGSLPVSKIEEMINEMKKMKIDVTYSIVEENGHEYPDKNTNEMYFNWLTSTIK